MIEAKTFIKISEIQKTELSTWTIYFSSKW